MRLFFKILKLLPAILIILIIIEIALDPLNLLFRKDKELKRVEPRNKTEEDIIPENPYQQKKKELGKPGSKENNIAAVPGQEQNDEQKDADPQGSGKSGDTKKSKDYFMTFNEVVSIEKISLKDKITGLAIIRKLSREDIKKLLDIANGGITTAEFENVKQLLEQALSEKDCNTLNELLLRNKRLYAEGRLAK